MSEQLRRRARAAATVITVLLAVGMFVVLYLGTRTISPNACAGPCDCVRVVDRPCR